MKAVSGKIDTVFTCPADCFAQLFFKDPEIDFETF
jgi:hypothetical protein